MADKDPELSIIIPVFNEQNAIWPFLTTMQNALSELHETIEYVFVDDGSTDATVQEIRSRMDSDLQIKLLVLSRNFGKDSALAAGLMHASGRAAIPIDVDLQDSPNVIPEMVTKWHAGAKVVNAKRVDRKNDSPLKRQSARLYYRIFNAMAEYPIPPDVGDFRLIDRQVIDILNTMPEKARFNKDLFSWVGFESAEVIFDRQARQTGRTKWSFWKLWNFGLDGLFGASTVPLRLWSYLGFCLAIASFIYAVYVLIRTVLFGIDTPGYASTLIIILFFGGLNMLSVGILGEYVGRIYREVRDRPLYIIQQTYESREEK
ncbi:glycosyltransferase family 2 protein [Sulfitobacter sp. 1151]|uniref:Glycosyltransferase family 2 protein n=1 Tax=Parasulfitobacter algicola TaxID=2614809 RepID=A0ABX2IWG0_9RHOB|nr:glycosyltransferase family 2 protein [Sulfitobacter algicola]